MLRNMFSSIRSNIASRWTVFFALIFIIASSNQLAAAGPVVHAYLSQRFFEKFPKYDQEEKKAFMLGTLFPDIQYLGEAARNETHCDHVSLEEVLREPSPFTAGLKFHSYVDWVREDFVADQKMYHQLNESGNTHPHSLFLKLKLLEDEAVYYSYNWQEWCETLKEIHPQELEWGMKLETIRKWHNLLSVCFSNPPSTIIFLLSITNASYLNVPSNEIKHWREGLKPTAKSYKIQRFVRAMLIHFEAKMNALSR